MSIAAGLLGVLIGGVLGALGGGGAILTVPALVYVIGQSAQDATTSSLVIVGLTAAVGALGHARSRHVRWRVGVSFGLAGTVAAFAGAALNRHLDPNLLLLGFAALMLLAATAMLLRAGPPAKPEQTAGEARPPSVGPAPGTGATRAAGPMQLMRADAGAAALADEHHLGVGLVVRIVLAGLVVGFLTGLFGVGGGFVIVPALVLVLRLPMPEAVGTSLLVIVINSAASLLARSGQVHFDWGVIVPFTATAMLGTLAGKRIADRLPAGTLTRAFAVLLVLVAGYVTVRSGLALL